MRKNAKSASPYEDMYGYSRAVRVGNTVHVAGTCAQPPHVNDTDAYGQARSAIDIIETALAEVDAKLSDVVRTIAYLTDISDTELVAKAHRESFGDIRPAATLVEVTALVDPAFKVEIEAYAIIDDEA